MKKETIFQFAPIIALILGVIMVAGALLLKQSNKKEYETLIEQLQIKNDSLKQSNELLDTQIAIQRAIADSLSKEIITTNKVIKKLKNVRYERIRAITNMDNNELLDFFSKFESRSTDN